VILKVIAEIFKQKERKMKDSSKSELKKSYVYVKDEDGVEYICKLEDLKKPDELSEEEKSRCMVPPGSA